MLTKVASSDHYDGRKGEIIKMGYLKKLKTMKRKFFILRAESSEASARLEYYDNEKKWRNQQAPKRTITLKTCFNINRRRDTKYKNVIGLYQKVDCFCLVLDTEEELDSWLKSLLQLQYGDDVVDGEPPKPIFEHVWRVTLQAKGLGDSKNLVGPYHVCLTDQTLSLVKITDEDEQKPVSLDFPLIYIRSCGVMGSFLYIEVGRQTVTGAGALWMLTEDATIAKNMNQVIFSAFSLQQKDGDLPRTRSSSESCKPGLSRRQTHTASKSLTVGYSEDGGGGSLLHHMANKNQTGAEHDHPHVVAVSSSLALPLHSRHVTSRPPSQRRHSVSAVSSSSVLVGVGGVSTTAHPHMNHLQYHKPDTTHQRTKSCPVSESPSSTSSSSFSSCLPAARRTHTTARSMTGPRERSDSMPSKWRTTSESGGGGHHHHHHTMSSSAVLPHLTRLPQYQSQYTFSRPRGVAVSHSPPCSTDSAGSSLSIDDGEMDLSATSPRTNYGHSSTPDEPAIMEENFDECGNWNPSTVEEETEQSSYYQYVPMNMGLVSALLTTPSANVQRKISEPLAVVANQDSSYVSMNPTSAVPAANRRKISEPAYVKSHSPLHSYGTSPMDQGAGNYLPMSPVSGDGVRRPHVTHSRASSLTEETPEGYVPMAPNHTDDGYVDMDPVTNHRLAGDDYQNSDMSPGSSCSITSGTPSTDIRFSEYHLEKVSSYFTPSEEDEERPTRAYSFGSRPENMKAESNDTCRSRAFSVGSKMGKWGPRSLIHEAQKLKSRSQPQTGPKSSSAPILSSSWSGTTYRTPNSDLMEIDFTKNNNNNKKKPRSKVATVLETSSLQLNLDQRVVTSSSDSGYMDMSSKSPSGEQSATSPPRSHYTNVSKPLTISSLFSPPSYMDMSRVSKPTIVSSSTLKTIGEKGDIKPQKFPTTSSANLNISALPNKFNSPKTEDQSYMDMTPKTTKKVVKAKSDKDMRVKNNNKTEVSNVSGKQSYLMELSYGASSAKVTKKSVQEDYMPMSFGGPTMASQPISIKGPCQKELVKNSSSVSPGCRLSSTTPPKVPPSYLSLGGSMSPFSSARRNQKRRNSRKKYGERRESKENVTITPTGSNSEIFPLCLNSPGSPLKTFSPPKQDDSYVNDSSTPTNSSPNVETDSPLDEIKEHDYIEIDTVPLSRVLRISSKDNSDAGDEHGDYACMKPVQTTKNVLEISSNNCTATTDTNIAQNNLTTTATAATGSDRLSSVTSPTARCSSSPVTTTTVVVCSRQLSTSSTTSGSPHSGVCRQVSSSSSSSTDVPSVKEDVTDRIITYASLDLAPSGSESEEMMGGARSPRTSPNPCEPSAFTYAEIDFVKSESLRTYKSNKKKFRH